jgi:signal transduction histidine kinase
MHHGPVSLPPTVRATAPALRTLLVLLVLAVYLPSLVAAVVVVALQARSTTTATQEGLQERSAALARMLRVRMDTVRHGLHALAADRAIDAADWRSFDAAARSMAAEIGVDAVILGRPDGVQVVNTRLPWGAPLPRDSPEALRRVAQSARSTVLPVSGSPASGHLVVGAAEPVMRDGRVAYVLTAVLDTARLQELLQATPAGWIGAIVDSNGIVAARSPLPGQFVGKRVTAELQDWLGAGDAGTFPTTTLDGVPVLTSFQAVPWIGWTAVVSVPASTLYEPAWRQALLLAGGAALLLAFSLWLALRLQASIVRSMQALVHDEDVPPESGALVPLGFREANEVRTQLRTQALHLSQAQRSVERMHQEFERALVQEAGRRDARVAAELHDAVGAGLSGVLMLLQELRARAGGRDAQQWSLVLEELQRAVDGVRRISRGMLPAGQDRGGLGAALEQLAAECGSLDRRCTFRGRGDCGSIGADTGTHLFRIAQEAITNAVRHGQATQVRIMLACVPGRCRLTIDDDGHGTQTPDLLAGHGIGLRSMRTRVLAMQGELEVTRSPLGGWRVRVTLDGATGGAAPDGSCCGSEHGTA